MQPNQQPVYMQETNKAQNIIGIILFELVFVPICLIIVFGLLNYYNVLPLSSKISFLAFLPHRVKSVQETTPSISPPPRPTLSLQEALKIQEESLKKATNSAATTILDERRDSIVKQTDLLIDTHTTILTTILSLITNDPDLSNGSYSLSLKAYKDTLTSMLSDLQMLKDRQGPDNQPTALLDEQQIKYKLVNYPTIEAKEIIFLTISHFSLRVTRELSYLNQVEPAIKNYQGKNKASLLRLQETTKQDLDKARQHMNNYYQHFDTLQQANALPNNQIQSLLQDMLSYEKEMQQDLTTIKSDFEQIRTAFSPS